MLVPSQVSAGSSMTTLPGCWHWKPLENRLCTDLIRGKVVGYCECGFPFSQPPYPKPGVEGGLTRRPKIPFHMCMYIYKYSAQSNAKLMLHTRQMLQQKCKILPPSGKLCSALLT